MVNLPIDNIDGYNVYCMDVYAFSSADTACDFTAIDTASDGTKSIRIKVHNFTAGTSATIRALVLYVKR